LLGGFLGGVGGGGGRWGRLQDEVGGTEVCKGFVCKLPEATFSSLTCLPSNLPSPLYTPPVVL
jgi:hypothetical protein